MSNVSDPFGGMDPATTHPVERARLEQLAVDDDRVAGALRQADAEAEASRKLAALGHPGYGGAFAELVLRLIEVDAMSPAVAIDKAYRVGEKLTEPIAWQVIGEVEGWPHEHAEEAAG